MWRGGGERERVRERKGERKKEGERKREIKKVAIDRARAGKR